MTEAEPAQQPTRRIPRRRLIILAIAAGIVLSLVIAFVHVRFGWNWTGFSTRTLWDWLELLLVPLLLAGAGAYLNHLDNRRRERDEQARFKQQQRDEYTRLEQQQREDNIRRKQQEREEELNEQRQRREALEMRRRDEEHYREETVRKYFDDMAYLMVDRRLLELVQSVEPEQTETKRQAGKHIRSEYVDPRKIEEVLKNPVWHMAQTRTITVLRRMAYKPIIEDTHNNQEQETMVDVQRANEILSFLRDSGLLSSPGGVLRQANLSETYLSGVNLDFANLSDADLSSTNLAGAYLWRANLAGAYLWETRFC